MLDGHLNSCKTCRSIRTKHDRRNRPVDHKGNRIRNGRATSKIARAENLKRWRGEHPEKHLAELAVSRAIRAGRLIKGVCEVCGSANNIHGHHDDYSKQLDVRWLCALHHRRLHANVPLTICLGNLRVTVDAPSFKLTSKQETEISKWWSDRLDRDARRTLGLPDVD